MSLPLKIAQISTLDNIGGAAKVAWNLYNAYLKQGCESWMLVGYKTINDPNIIQIPNDLYRGSWSKFWEKAANICSTPVTSVIPGAGMIRNVFINVIGQPKRWIDQKLGIENFNFPGSSHILDLLPKHPDIIQCHNLHGGYFDLRVLPLLSSQFPVVLTLHDAWLASGHCAHSFDCDRWKLGCGQCHDLQIQPAIRYDSTAYNWRRKQKIFDKSRVYVATPSQWLMDRVKESMLAPAIEESKVIPNGVDLSIFYPYDKGKARDELALPQDSKILLFAANGIRDNIWKDYHTMREAIARVVVQNNMRNLMFLAIGEETPPEKIGNAIVKFIPHQKSTVLARYYQAADIYLHATKVDTFPNTVIEALACGTPVIATSVGGIPEQIKSMSIRCLAEENSKYSTSDITGILVPKGDAEAMSNAITYLFKNMGLLKTLSENAAKDARIRFDLKLQAALYLEWFQKIYITFNRVN